MRNLYRIFLFVSILTIFSTVLSGYPQERTVYKIQVASSLKEYSTDRIKGDLGLSEEVVMHFIGGRYKYFVGNFATRAEATAYLPDVPVEGAWVVPVRVQDEVVEKPVTEAAVKEEEATKPQVTETEARQETETDMAFRIQVAADRKFVDPERIKREKGLQDYEVDYYLVQGWYKYYLGDFPTREEAENYRVSKGINGWVVEAPIVRQISQEQEPAVKADTGALSKEDSASLAFLNDSLKVAEGISRIQKEYSEIIREADSVFERGEDLEAAKRLYENASRVDPTKVHPKNQIKKISELLSKRQTGYLSKNVVVLFIGVVVLIVIMLAVLFVTLTLRTRRKKLEKKKEAFKDELQDSMAEYLFDEETSQADITSKIRSAGDKQVVIDEIMQLYANLSGEISNKLRELYIDLGLENESVAKTQSHQWHIRAKGFRELAQMNIKTVNDEIEKCLNSDNDVLRMEAQLAMIRLNYEDPFSFLNKLEKPFTAWEQLHVYEMITRNQVSLPDFTNWLDSRNESIVIFCIRMIRAFKQAEGYQKLIKFLDHSNAEIRQETVSTFGELRILETLPVLKDRFALENQQTKLMILQAMAKMPEEENIEFLQSILEPSNALRLEAAEALSRIESFGVKGIETIIRRSDDDLQAVARHILDSKTR